MSDDRRKRSEYMAELFRQARVRFPEQTGAALALDLVHYQARADARRAREREALEHSQGELQTRLLEDWRLRVRWDVREDWEMDHNWVRLRREDLEDIRGMVATLRIIKRRLAELHHGQDDQVDACTYAWETLHQARGARREFLAADWDHASGPLRYPPPPYPAGTHPRSVLVDPTHDSTVTPMEAAVAELFPVSSRPPVRPDFRPRKGWEVDVPPPCGVCGAAGRCLHGRW